MIQGLRTVIYAVTDLFRAKEWYGMVLGKEPYFDQPFYVGYNVGGFELGLIPDGKPGAGGTMAYWGVPDAAAELNRLQGLGAKVNEAVQEVGGGVKTATVLDPFGNVFGIIENPHFDAKQVQ